MIAADRPATRRRSLATLLFAVLALQLVWPVAGIACATEPGASAASLTAAQGSHDAHAGHGATRPAPLDAQGSDDEDAGHREPAHCATAAACTMVALAGDDTGALVGSHPVARDTITSDESAPASRRRAPEPPPPRA